jgi:hypothetical protein
VLKGEVLAHSPERDDIYAAFDRREGKSVAVEYTGQVPTDIDYLISSQSQQLAFL